MREKKLINVEHELRNLNVYKAKIENLKLLLIDKKSASMPPGTGIEPSTIDYADPTGEEAAKQTDIKRQIDFLAAKVLQIENALHILDEEEYELIDLRYLRIHRMSNEGVALHCHISRSQFYAVRDRALEKIASCIPVISEKREDSITYRHKH